MPAQEREGGRNVEHDRFWTPQSKYEHPTNGCAFPRSRASHEWGAPDALQEGRKFGAHTDEDDAQAVANDFGGGQGVDVLEPVAVCLVTTSQGVAHLRHAEDVAAEACTGVHTRTRVRTVHLSEALASIAVTVAAECRWAAVYRLAVVKPLADGR